MKYFPTTIVDAVWKRLEEAFTIFTKADLLSTVDYLLKNEYFPSPSFRYIFENPKLISWLVKTGTFGVYKDALSKAGLYTAGKNKSLDFEILVSLDDRGIKTVEIWNDCVGKHLDKLLAWGFRPVSSMIDLLSMTESSMKQLSPFSIDALFKIFLIPEKLPADEGPMDENKKPFLWRYLNSFNMTKPRSSDALIFQVLLERTAQASHIPATYQVLLPKFSGGTIHAEKVRIPLLKAGLSVNVDLMKEFMQKVVDEHYYFYDDVSNPGMWDRVGRELSQDKDDNNKDDNNKDVLEGRISSLSCLADIITHGKEVPSWNSLGDADLHKFLTILIHSAMVTPTLFNSSLITCMDWALKSAGRESSTVLSELVTHIFHGVNRKEFSPPSIDHDSWLKNLLYIFNQLLSLTKKEECQKIISSCFQFIKNDVHAFPYRLHDWTPIFIKVLLCYRQRNKSGLISDAILKKVEEVKLRFQEKRFSAYYKASESQEISSTLGRILESMREFNDMIKHNKRKEVVMEVCFDNCRVVRR
jgi:hypothetical protein